MDAGILVRHKIVHLAICHTEVAGSESPDRSDYLNSMVQSENAQIIYSDYSLWIWNGTKNLRSLRKILIWLCERPELHRFELWIREMICGCISVYTMNLIVVTPPKHEGMIPFGRIGWGITIGVHVFSCVHDLIYWIWLINSHWNSSRNWSIPEARELFIVQIPLLVIVQIP